MPDVSRNQQIAMIIAKKGKSTLGIPKSVGEDFIAADNAAGNPPLPKKVGKKPASKPLGESF